MLALARDQTNIKILSLPSCIALPLAYGHWQSCMLCRGSVMRQQRVFADSLPLGFGA